MTRRTVERIGPWAEMRAAFRWHLPVRFNVAEACCGAWAREAPDRTAIVDLSDGRRVWSYADLQAASDALAAHLAAGGVRRGDRVAILLAQRAEVMVAHFAAMRLGAVSLPLFTLFGPDALAYRLRDSGARAIVADRDGLDRLATLDLPDLVARVDADALPGEGGVAPAETGPDDPAMLIYTSGTTGPPKGVLHAHRFLIGHLPCFEIVFPDVSGRDVGWTPADWAWIGGLMDLAMPCLHHGVPVVARRFAKFDSAAAWALLSSEGVTCAFLPPAALRAMRRVPPPAGLALRAVMSGGEALGADLVEWGRDAVGTSISEIYGQTECNLVLAACDEGQDRMPGTLGLPVPGVDVAVMDEGGRPVPDGAVGEICTRGSPAAFLRYWNRPDATAAKWRDGWLRTGDLGVALPGGTIRYHARDDDVINASGYRIGPSEVETCLMAHPRVEAAAVVGLPDPERGEVVAAFVVAGAPDDALAADLAAWVRARLSPHMAPRSVRFVDDLPRTATGKVMRRALRSAG